MIWQYTDEDGDTVFLAPIGSSDFELEIKPQSGDEGGLVYMTTDALISLDVAVRKALRSRGCDLPGEPVT